MKLDYTKRQNSHDNDSLQEINQIYYTKKGRADGKSKQPYNSALDRINFDFNEDYSHKNIQFRIKPSRMEKHQSQLRESKQALTLNLKQLDRNLNQYYPPNLSMPYRKSITYAKTKQNLDLRLKKTISQFKEFFKTDQHPPILPFNFLDLLQKYGVTSINRTSYYEFMDIPFVDYNRKQLNVWLSTTKKDFVDWQRYGGSLQKYYNGNQGKQITFNDIMKYRGLQARKGSRRRNQANYDQIVEKRKNQRITDEEANRVSLFKFQKIVVENIDTKPNDIDYLKRWFNVFRVQNQKKFESIFRLEYQMLQDYQRNQYIQIRGALTPDQFQSARDLKVYLYGVKLCFSNLFKDDECGDFVQSPQNKKLKEYFDCSVIRFRSVIRSFIRHMIKMVEFYLESKLQQSIKPTTGRQIEVLISPFFKAAKDNKKRHELRNFTELGRKILMIMFDLKKNLEKISDNQILSFYNSLLQVLFTNEKQRYQSTTSKTHTVPFQVKHIPFKEFQGELSIAERMIENEIHTKRYEFSEVFDFKKPNIRGYAWTQQFQITMMKIFIKLKSLAKIRNFWYEKFRSQNNEQYEEDITNKKKNSWHIQIQAHDKQSQDQKSDQSDEYQQKQNQQIFQSNQQKGKYTQKLQEDLNDSIQRIKTFSKKKSNNQKKNEKKNEDMNLQRSIHNQKQSQNEMDRNQQNTQGFRSKYKQKNKNAEIQVQPTSLYQNQLRLSAQKKLREKQSICKYFRYASIKHNFTVLHRKVLEQLQQILHHLIHRLKFNKISFSIKKFLFLKRQQKICLLSHMEGLKCMLMMDEFWIQWKQRQIQEEKRKNQEQIKKLQAKSYANSLKDKARKAKQNQLDKDRENIKLIRTQEFEDEYKDKLNETSSNHFQDSEGKIRSTDDQQEYFSQNSLIFQSQDAESQNQRNQKANEAISNKERMKQIQQEKYIQRMQYPMLYITYICECVLEYLQTKKHLKNVLKENQKQKLKIYDLRQVIRGSLHKKMSVKIKQKDMIKWKMSQYQALEKIQTKNTIGSSTNQEQKIIAQKLNGKQKILQQNKDQINIQQESYKKQVKQNKRKSNKGSKRISKKQKNKIKNKEDQDQSPSERNQAQVKQVRNKKIKRINKPKQIKQKNNEPQTINLKKLTIFENNEVRIKNQQLNEQEQSQHQNYGPNREKFDQSMEQNKSLDQQSEISKLQFQDKINENNNSTQQKQEEQNEHANTEDNLFDELQNSSKDKDSDFSLKYQAKDKHYLNQSKQKQSNEFFDSEKSQKSSQSRSKPTKRKEIQKPAKQKLINKKNIFLSREQNMQKVTLENRSQNKKKNNLKNSFNFKMPQITFSF